jgi:SAM-dependent methyltransferase
MTDQKPVLRHLRILTLGGLIIAFGVALIVAIPVSSSVIATSQSDGRYTYRSPSGDGIGKVYLGREIAGVMGHRGAFWLERPGREWEEQPQKLVDALDIAPDTVVADIGAGTGYMTFRLASRVPDGEVLAVDIQPEMLDIIEFLKQDGHVQNVTTVLAEPDHPHLPQGVDLALMVDAYHEFKYPYEVMTSVVDALNPGGQVVLVEYRGENPLIPIKRLHKMTERQVRRELTAVGLKWVKTDEILPRQHLLIFEKPPDNLPEMISPQTF